MEANKILAALLVAGIIAMLAGFISNGLMGTEKHDGEHAKNAYHIDVAEAATATADSVKAAPVGAEPIADLLADADVARGQKISKACAACHSFDKGGKAKTGPNLWGIVGRNVASISGFSYSSAMQAKGGKWGYDELNSFLWKPKKTVKGTKMNFVGLKKTKDRAAIVAWMRTLNDQPLPLP